MKNIAYKIFVNVFLILQVDFPCYSQDKKDTAYVLLSDICYTPGDTLKTDFFLPVNYQSQKNPVLVFIDGFGGDFRKSDHYTNWARFATSEGFISIVYASRKDYIKKSFESLLDFLFTKSDKYYTDLSKISVYAGSGNVAQGLPLANGDERIKAALIFYGIAKIENFRPDMPVLLVRAGLDNVQLNKQLDSLAFRALTVNAPYTIANFNTVQHGFEDFTGDTISLQFLKSTLVFLKDNMTDKIRQNFSAHRQEVIAMKELYHSNWQAAFEGYRRVLQMSPANNEAERQLGNICIELKEYKKALDYYDSAIVHGNWRKGEVALKKLYVYAKLNNVEAAITEMSLLKKIGWFKEGDYNGKDEYSSIVNSEEYKKFTRKQ